MKIVQINCVYKHGSTGKIVSDLSSYFLSQGHESFVLYGRGEKKVDINSKKISSEFEAKVHGLLSRFFGIDFAYSPISTRKCINYIKNIKPDIVHLHCLNGHFVNAYKLIDFLKTNHIKTVLTLHAEIMHTAGCEHALQCDKWKTGCNNCTKVSGYISRFFRDDSKISFERMFDAFYNFPELIVVGCSEWISFRASQSYIFKNAKIVTVHNGIDTESFHYSNSREMICKRLNIDLNKKIVLHVNSRFDSFIKGGNYIVKLSKMLPDYQFIVVGSKNFKDEANIKFIEKTTNKKELAEYYSAADCLAITSVCETYPTVCLEAASCGLNIVGFDCGGTKETIPNGGGETVRPYDLREFSAAIKKWCNSPKKTKRKIRTPNDMAKEYLEIYKKENYE